MTIASQTSRIAYVGDGSTTAFAVPFYFAANVDLVVYLQDSLGNQTLQALGTNYNLSGATVSAGGTCTFITAPATGYLVTIYRDPPATQTTSYNNNDPFPAKSHETALDKLTTLAQRVKDSVARSIHQTEGEASMTTTLAPIATRKNKLFGFGTNGELIYPAGPTFVNSTATGVANIDSRATAQVTTIPVSTNIIQTGGGAVPGDGSDGLYKRVVSLAAGSSGFQSADGAWWQQLGKIAFDSRAAAVAAYIAPTQNIIRTGGFAAAGDGGDALYKRVISLASPTYGFQSADGAFWQIVPDTAGVNIKQFGAVADSGATDSRAAIQSAIDFAQTLALPTIISNGSFGIGSTTDGTNFFCLKLNGQSSLLGVGPGSTLMTLNGTTCNTIHVAPVANAMSNFRISDLVICGTPANGFRRQGVHGIYIDTRTALRGLAKPIIERLQINQGFVDATSTTVPTTGRAIFHENDQAGNPNGGVYGMLIRDCRELSGGVLFSLTGDQNQVINCIISGENSASQKCIGVDAALATTDGGGGFFTMQDITIVCKGGAWRVSSAINFIAERVYCENFGAAMGIPYIRPDTTTGFAVAVVDSTGSTIGSGRVSGCRFAPQGGVSTLVTAGLYIGNASKVVVTDDNQFFQATSNTYAVELSSQSGDCTVMNIKAAFSSTDKRVLDKGGRNRWSSIQDLTLAGGFTNFGAGFASAKVYRDHMGTIQLSGFVGAASIATGAVITTLPAGCRPGLNRILSVYADNAGAVVLGGVQILADGSVVYQGATCTRLDLSSVSFKSIDLFV